MVMHKQEDVFIDADEQWGNDVNNYEVIILHQIKECVKVLSREMTGGQVVHKAGATGTEKYIEDVNELVINHVDTLRMLLYSYIEKQSDNKEKLENLMQDIETKKTEIGNRNILVKGLGKIKVGNMKGIDVDTSHWKEFVHYKAHKYREVFGILVNSYNNYQEILKKAESE